MKNDSILLFIVFIGLLLGLSVPGYSATFTVTNSNDDGEGSLRQAVYQADINGEDDTIVIPAGIHIVFEHSYTTAKYLEINSNITIRGAGADTVSIDGNDGDRVFLIRGGNVNISGITIKNGQADSDGGGIYIKDASATITNCTITGNYARAGSRYSGVLGGGGIYVENTVITITGCIVTGNTAWAYGDSETTLAAGGGIFIDDSDATIIQSTISGNTTAAGRNFEGTLCGGGIYSENSSTAITGCTISTNKSRQGGGIYSGNGGISVTDCTISTNKSSQGGGIYSENSATAVTGCIISTNESSRQGGGIYSGNSGTTVTGCTISINESRTGGGIYILNPEGVDKRVEIRGNRITENNTHDMGSGNGGGLYLKAGTPENYPVVSDNTFEGNSAARSGGGCGGAMYLVRYAAVTHNLFQNNNACQGGIVPGKGGAVYMKGVLGADFISNRFIGNSVTDDAGATLGFGGAIHVESDAVFTMTNNLLAGNRTLWFGSAVSLGESLNDPIRCTMINNTFVDNYSRQKVGCISIGRDVELTMKNNIIKGHSMGIDTISITSGNTLSLDTNLFWNDSDPLTGTGAIFADPLLTEDYKLVERSPAVDAGLTIDGLTEDLDGTRRPLGGGFDIGAYEFDPSAPPAISINRTTFNFAGKAGYTTPGQTFLISNTGGGTLDWTAAPDAGWITVSPSAGTDSGLVTIGVDTTGLAPGTYTGTVSISDASASNSPRTVSVNLVIYRRGAPGVPFGRFSTPVDGSTVRGSIPVTGWALDDIGVESVKIFRDEGIYIGDAVFVEGARPDVEETYPGHPFNYTAGWGYMLLTNFLPDNGNGTFTIYAEAADKEGNTISLGTKTITCDNANAVKPFGAVDTPAQGGTASGDDHGNFGWVLTPQPNEIPRDGSTINVYVDGKLLGNPAYNIYREDIADLFPGYANSDGAAGYFSIDTTVYADGVHTISWTAEDNAGNTGGIGSRYFTIRNLAGSMGQGAWKSGGQRTEDGRRWGDDCGPVDVIKGFNRDANSQRFYPDENGDITVNTKELERVEIRFPGPVSNLSALPVGSTLDRERGIFYWQPGPGFVGEYPFVFIKKGPHGEMVKKIKIRILPKFNTSPGG